MKDLNDEEKTPSRLQSPDSNWVRSGLMVQQTSDCGWGVFTAEPIAAGELVVVYGGRVVTTDQVRSEDLQDWTSLGAGLVRYPSRSRADA